MLNIQNLAFVNPVMWFASPGAMGDRWLMIRDLIKILNYQQVTKKLEINMPGIWQHIWFLYAKKLDLLQNKYLDPPNPP